MVALSHNKTAGTAWLRLSKILVIISVLLYIIFCFSPLRLHYDSIRYYAIKDCIELGCPPDSDAAKDFFPFGYTALLLILSKLGILNSFTVVFTNVLFLFGGLALLYKVFEKHIHFSFLLVLVLFNWLFIKFVTHPLSEMQYLFFSMACIYFFHRFTQVKKIYFLLLAILFSWLALQTRTVGISLVAGIGVGLLWEFKDKLLLFLKRYKFLVAAVVLGLVAGVAVFAEQLGLRHYLGVFSTHSSDAPLLTRLGWHFTEWGEVLLNMPSGKAVQKLPAQIGSILFILVGVVFFAWFCFILFGKKNSIPFFIKAYLFFYIVILFNWPFADPRFWVPVVPIMAVVVLQSGIFAIKAIKIPATLFLGFYLVLGFVSAGFVIYSSFNKSFFAKTQANGVYQKEYEIHFFGKPSGNATISDSSTINPALIDLLKRHD